MYLKPPVKLKKFINVEYKTRRKIL